MNKMPGFTAEAAVYTSDEYHQMGGKYERPREGDQILPQEYKTACAHWSKNRCVYVCCSWDSDDPIFTMRCNESWICGHRRPDAGALYLY